MSLRTWTLTDVEHDLYVDQLLLTPQEVGGKAQGYQVRKRTLRGGLRDGVDVVEVDNGLLSFVVVPTRGMGLWRAQLGEVSLGWQSPAKGPVHPRYVNLAEPSGLGWLAGFDELMCRCGLESNGGPDRDAKGILLHPLHGRIANLPAHRVEVTIDDRTGEIAVTGLVDEARLYHNKLEIKSTYRTQPGAPWIEIEDEITNLSAEPGELQLVYHTNFGRPLLDAGAEVVLAAKTIIPQTPRAAEGLATWHRYGDEEAGFTEQVYFFELLGDSEGNTQTLLRNAHGNLGASLHFNLRELPWFTVWKSTQKAADGYVTGLEPGLNLPNPKTFEEAQGRVVRLAGGQRRRAKLKLEFHADADRVAEAQQAIGKLRGTTQPKVLSKPAKPWSPV